MHRQNLSTNVHRYLQQSGVRQTVRFARTRWWRADMLSDRVLPFVEEQDVPEIPLLIQTNGAKVGMRRV
jgi:hypothetical protein